MMPINGFKPILVVSIFSYNTNETRILLNKSFVFTRLDGLMEYSNDDDSLEKFLPTNIEFCQNEFEGFFSNANSDLSPGI